MIDSISIANVASFGGVPETMEGLSQFNFVFGSNATGKTTVTRVIADESAFPACRVNWKAGTRLQAMVYNRDFVEREFKQSAELKGVFTLGEKNIETLKRIAAAKAELDAITKRIETLSVSLHGQDGTGGKRGELTALETELRNKCWAQKQKHDAKLQGAFRGYRNSAEEFKRKVLHEWTSNSATIEELGELEKKAESLFGATPVAEAPIPPVQTKAILDHETAPILKKRVIGKEEVDIAAMIKRLGNSDWVRDGLTFYESNGRVCPCQRRNETGVKTAV